MLPLPAQFHSYGFDFRLLARKGRVALFQKTKFFPEAKPALRFKTFEVIIVQRKEAKEIMGRMTPAHEAMPSPNQWGRLGWSLQTEERAKKKFEEEVELRKWRNENQNS